MELQHYAGVDTRQSPSGKLVLRTRRYNVNGTVYNIIKHFLHGGCYQLSVNTGVDKPVRGETVNGEIEWGRGLTWKQAEAIAAKRIERLEGLKEMMSQIK